MYDSPDPDNHRRITDVCCCAIGVLFGLIMFILACVLFNSSNLVRANFPIDSDLHSCILDANSQGQKRPFIFFDDLSNPLSSRKCVQ